MLTLKWTGRRHDPELLGQTVVVLGGSPGVGLEIARSARAEGADVILAGSDPERLERAALEVGARSAAAFEAGGQAALRRFFDELSGPIDHVVIAGGVGERIPPAIDVARSAVGRIRRGGTLVLVDGTGPSFTAALGVALAPVGVRAAGIGPVLAEPDDIAARAVRLMANTQLDGATENIDGDPQLVARAA